MLQVLTHATIPSPPENPRYWEIKSREDLIKMAEAAPAFLKFSGEKLAIKID